MVKSICAFKELWEVSLANLGSEEPAKPWSSSPSSLSSSRVSFDVFLCQLTSDMSMTSMTCW